MPEITEIQKPEQKKKRGSPQNLIKYVKGQSGNPNGRPKKGTAIADILSNMGDELVEVNGKKITKRQAVMMKVYQLAVKGESWAVNFIADRTEGKAVDRIIHKEIVDEIIIG